MKLFGKNEIEKDNIKIGIIDDNEIEIIDDNEIGTTDFCLICLSLCHHLNNQDSHTFYIHKKCFGYTNRIGDIRQFYKDANDVYKKKKDNISKVLSLREKYKIYVNERNNKED